MSKPEKLDSPETSPIDETPSLAESGETAMAPLDSALIGKWKAVSMQVNGESQSFANNLRFTFTSDHRMITTSDNDLVAGNKGPTGPIAVYHVNPPQDPKEISIVKGHPQGALIDQGTYRVDDDTLTICSDHLDKRPKTFDSKGAMARTLWILKKDLDFAGQK